MRCSRTCFRLLLLFLSDSPSFLSPSRPFLKGLKIVVMKRSGNLSILLAGRSSAAAQNYLSNPQHHTKKLEISSNVQRLTSRSKFLHPNCALDSASFINRSTTREGEGGGGKPIPGFGLCKLDGTRNGRLAGRGPGGTRGIRKLGRKKMDGDWEYGVGTTSEALNSLSVLPLLQILPPKPFA